MIQSMTAFARISEQGEWGQATWEIRSVNHRYLEASFRMPEGLREFELDLRECLREQIARGKIECSLRFIPSQSTGASLSLNVPLIENLIKLSLQATKLGAAEKPPKAIELLKWPDAVQQADLEASQLKAPILDSFKRAVAELTEVREREGLGLLAHLNSRLDQIESILAKLKEVTPKMITAYMEKIEARLAQLTTEMDPQRLEQECVLVAQKLDVTEEMDRLQTHLIEMRRILTLEEPVGRRLDFLMQEMNREANTLGSKSSQTETTKLVVDIKVLIEQMREQVQNIE